MKVAVTVAIALQQATESGLARIDAQLLLLHALGKTSLDRAWLISHGSDALDDAACIRFSGFMARRMDHEPVAYILGRKAFFGLDLQIDHNVLDPRDDTETLVEWALALPIGERAKVLDMGTGSGAIALALAAGRPSWSVHALDASPSALKVAKGNAKRHKLAVQFHEGNWWDALAPIGPQTSSRGDKAEAPRFDLIVSNPPYIADGDPHLACLHHEPALALTSGVDGTDALKIIVQGAPKYLRSGSWLLLEHGHDQADAVIRMLKAEGFCQVCSKRDLSGVLRCTGGQMPNAG